jgi:hypothetical protein
MTFFFTGSAGSVATSTAVSIGVGAFFTTFLTTGSGATTGTGAAT